MNEMTDLYPVVYLDGAVFTPLQEKLFGHINKYRDVVFSNRSIANAKELRNLYALHAMNHVTK
jgi:U3 small nucleolar RNA-associated protein 25